MSTAHVRDKVVIVTGAGRGIGREVALLMAAEGAAVVVNDVGGSATGEGRDEAPAREVADLIVASGGRAIWNCNDVSQPASAEAIVEAALSWFGRVDCVVNNAGILRDRSFHHLDTADWNAVLDVHLGGSFYVSRAAAPHFKRQGGGCFVHMVSTAGLIGAYGQANYAAAKMGVAALSRSIAMEMARYNVRSNCVAPFASTRLTETIRPVTQEQKRKLDHLRTLRPEQVAPLVVFLASDGARDVSGQIFVSHGNEVYLMSQPRPVARLHREGVWTVSDLNSTLIPAFKEAFTALETATQIFEFGGGK